MIYTDWFYFPFLLASLLVYWLVARSSKQRLFLIALLSFSFIAYKHTRGAVFLFILSSLVYFLGRKLEKSKNNLKLFLFIIIPLSVLLCFKYILPLYWRFYNFPILIVPLGLSYYTFKHIHYLVESSRKTVEKHTFIEYIGYIFFFPMFMSGPIERFNNFHSQLKNIEFRWLNVSVGLERIVIGSIKKFLIADILLNAIYPEFPLLVDGTVYLPWYHVLFVSFIRFLITYIDFSGYTDMAIGTGLLFGIRLMENFNFPILRSNLPDFWRSWHISLTSWVRDYIYYPILVTMRRTELALLVTMLTIGIWHGPYGGWLLWGVHHGLGLIILGKFRKWTAHSRKIRNYSTTLWWKVLGVLGVWWYVAAAYSLTIFPDDLMASLKLYSKIIFFGLL